MMVKGKAFLRPKESMFITLFTVNHYLNVIKMNRLDTLCICFRSRHPSLSVLCGVMVDAVVEVKFLMGLSSHQLPAAILLTLMAVA